MKYRLVNIEWESEPKKFYRKLYIQDDLNLVDFGCILLTSLNAAFEHEFLFRTKDLSYLPKSFDLDMDNAVHMSKYKYTDLGNNFQLHYDTGEGWEFNITVSKTTKELECEDLVLFVEGKGLGIWEDYICGLWEYVSGKTKPNTKRKPGEDWSFPWNLDMQTFADWDECDPVLNKYLSEFSIQNIKDYKAPRR